MVEAMVALTLVDALMQQKAQCELFDDLSNGDANDNEFQQVKESSLNPLGKKVRAHGSN